MSGKGLLAALRLENVQRTIVLGGMTGMKRGREVGPHFWLMLMCMGVCDWRLSGAHLVSIVGRVLLPDSVLYHDTYDADEGCKSRNCGARFRSRVVMTS